MSFFDTKRTADYSPLAVHFTKSHRMVCEDLIIEDNPLFNFRETDAKNRLINILTHRVIHTSPMPFISSNPTAICFTECIWEGLTSLVDKYSPYGIVFRKRQLFDLGGGPALYLRGDVLVGTEDQIPQALRSFIAPFDPEARIREGVPLDWLHEREWRLPVSLQFEYADIVHVLVDTIQEATEIVHQIGAQNLPESKMIPMEVYRNVNTAWSEE